MRRLGVLVGLIATIGSALVALPGVAGAAPRGEAEARPIRRMLILSVPVLTWEDVNRNPMPNLNRLLDRSAIADLTTRTISRRTKLSDGYVTLGAGTRSIGAGTPLDGEAFDAQEVVGRSTAGEVFGRRTGDPAEDGLVHLAASAIETRNESELYDAEVGALGDALDAAGYSRAVIGNADGLDLDDVGDDFYRRQAVAGLMGSDGTVPGGTVDDALLVEDTDAPFGVRLDDRAVLNAFDEVWQPDSVVLVEASDLVREDVYRKFASAEERPKLFRQAVQHTDRMIGQLLEKVDFERDAVVVVGPTHAQHEIRLTLMALRAPDMEPGLLRTGTTRRSGFVQLVDVAPTILDRLGVEQPDSMEGRPAEVGARGGSVADRRQLLEDADAAARFRDEQVGAVSVIMVVVAGLLGAATIVMLVARASFPSVRVDWLPGVIRAAALAYLGYIPAVYLARLVPFYDLGAPLYYVFLVGVALILAFLYSRLLTEHALDPIMLALAVIIVLLLTDAVVGAPLQFNSALGYSPKVAGRFSGFGNLGYAALTASALLLSALLAHRIGGRRGVRVGVGLLVVVFIVDGAPFWGSDVGGILSILPAFAVTAYLLIGRRVRARSVVVFLAATIAAVIGFGFLDLTRPSDQRTHLGRLFERIGTDGWSGFETVVLRKASSNLETIGNSVWLWMLPLVGGFVVFLLVQERRRLRMIFDRVPELGAATVGFVVLNALGYALNDSGVAVPGMMLGIANAMLATLVVWTVERPTDDETVDTPDGDAFAEVSEAVGSRR